MRLLIYNIAYGTGSAGGIKSIFSAHRYLRTTNSVIRSIAEFINQSNADVVGLVDLTLVENNINCACVILYKQPVAYVLTLTIHWQWLALADIIDKQRDQLLRELIWTVVIRAVGHDSWHTISVVVSTYKVI